MRTLLAAALFLSPLALAAQTNQPAQNLQARLAPHAFAAAKNDAHPTAPVRVSTGVVAPQLIHTVDIETEEHSIFAVAGMPRKVTVSMIVDATGTPNNLKVVETEDPAANSNVLHAVSQYRFKPGTLSNEPTAVPVNLEITMQPAR